MDTEELTMPINTDALAILAKNRRLVVRYRETAKRLRAEGLLDVAKEYDRLADAIKTLADEWEKNHC